MNTKRPAAPAFINRLDRHLLLNKPEVWSARTHLVVYYGLLFIGVLALLSFIVPDDPRKDSPAAYWIGFVSLIAFIALIGWLIYLLRFNVFKRYGITSAANRLITFILYFIAIGTFVLFSYVEPYVETVRANGRYTDAEIVQDMNDANLDVCRLEYDSLNHKWSADTVLVTDRKQDYESSENASAVIADTIVLVPHTPRIEINREALQNRLATADSVQKLNDSVYVFAECPTYTLLQTYRIEPDAAVKPFTSLDIYRRAIQNYTPPTNKQEIQNRLAAIRTKYQWQSNYPDYYTDPYNVTERIKKRYGLWAISSSMDNILERKHRWAPRNLQGFVRIFLYTTLVLTLLLFAFRHSTAKTFFLSLLTGIVLSIFTSLVMAFSHQGSNAFFEWVLFYFLLFFAGSLTVFKMQKRNVFTGIAINLFLWLLPFMPLCLVANYYADRKYDQNYDYRYDYSVQQLHLLWAEIGGLILLLIVIATYIHRIYRKWHAAPED